MSSHADIPMADYNYQLNMPMPHPEFHSVLLAIGDPFSETGPVLMIRGTQESVRNYLMAAERVIHQAVAKAGENAEEASQS